MRRVAGWDRARPAAVALLVASGLLAAPFAPSASATSGAPPTVSAGPDQVLTVADTALLAGRVSDDGLPDPSQVEVRWTVVSGPGAVTFGRQDEAFTSARFGAAGTYVLRVQADDGAATATDEVALTVRAEHTTVLRVPADYPTVQTALDAAPPHALVLLSPGIYRENVVVPRTLTLASTYYTTGDRALVDSTVISGPAGDVDTIGVAAAAGPDTRIVGVTVRDGKDGIETASGGGLVAEHNVVMSGSDGFDFPRGSTGLVQHNTMALNGDDGVDIDESSVVILDNLVRDNQGDGVEARMTDVTAPQRGVVIRGNRFTGNRQDGLQIIDQDTISSRAQSASLFTIERNVLADNGEAGLGLLDNGQTSEDYSGASLNERVTVVGNTFARNNHGIVGGDNLVAVNNVLLGHAGPALKNVDGSSVTAYNQFFGNGAPNTSSNVDAATAFSGDPMLDSTFAPLPGSPVVDAGTTQLTLPGGEVAVQVADFRGSAPDLGAVESDGTGDGNRAPVVSAGPDLTVALPTSAQLTGSVTDDGRPAGGTLTRLWSVDSGPGPVTFGDATAATTTASFSTAGGYVLRLTASDGDLTGTDTVAVTVNDAEPGGGTTTTVEARVATGSDDAEESPSGSVSLSSSDIELVADGSRVQTVGLRFPALQVPRGAAVTSARIQFQAHQVKTAATSLSIAAQDADNASAFTSASRDVSSRPRTPTVAWTPPAWHTVGERGASQQTPDLSSALQRVVSRPGWAHGNAVAFIVTGSGVRTAVAFETRPTAAAVLQVTYATGGTDANAAPVVDAGADQSVTLPASASLAGTVADDGLPAGSTVTSSWSVVSGPGSVTFASGSTPATTASFSAAGSYVLQLTATDGDLSASDTTTVTVADAPPSGGTVTTLTVRPGTGSDDAEESSNGSVALTSGDLELVTDGASVQTVGLRFPGLSVPRGATVTQAHLQLQTDEVSTDVASLTLRGQAADDAPTFTTASRNVSGRATTAATVTWTPPTWPTVGARGSAQASPDLRTLLQEVVNRPGWASGNAVALVVTGSGRRTAEAFESGAALGPSLTVSWTAGDGTGPANTAPAVDAGPDQAVILPASATLAGSVTDDGLPAGSTPTAAWSTVSGPGTVTFGSPTATSTTASFSAAGSYVLRLSASDGELTGSDTLTVTVSDAPPPGGTVTSLDVRVGTGSDDAEESPRGSVNLSSSDLELVTDGSSLQTVGLRFPAVQLPRNATVVRAWVQFSTDEAGTAAATLSVAAQDADDAATFTTTSGDVSARPRTPSVAWSPAPWTTVGARGPDQRTPDLAACLQHVVDRAGWTPGNAVAVLVTGTGVRTAVALEGASAGAPVLHVEFLS